MGPFSTATAAVFLWYLFGIWLLPEEENDVECFTTNSVLLTATLALGSVQNY